MSKKSHPSSRQSEYTLVYSTAEGRICPDCSRAVDDCTCRKQRGSSSDDGIVRVSRSTKGRRGKGVTVISGIPLTGDALKDLVQKLKQRCGAGGTVKDGTVEIQGEHRDFLVAELKKIGYIVKRSGN